MSTPIRLIDPLPDCVAPSAEEIAHYNSTVSSPEDQQQETTTGTAKTSVPRCSRCNSEIGTPGYLFVGNRVQPCPRCNGIL